MEASSNYYRPLHMFFHLVSYQLSGNEPYAYHGISILLHALSYAPGRAHRAGIDRGSAAVAGGRTALLLQGRYDDALLMAQRALDIYPMHGEAYLIMGRAYASKGMLDRARQAIEAARRADPFKAADVEAELKALNSRRP